MILIVFLIITLLLLFLYYLFIQKIPIKLIAKKLGAKYQIFGQNGLFSFSSLFLDLPEFYVGISKSKVGINPFAILIKNKKFLTISIAKLRLKVKKVTNNSNIESDKQNSESKSTSKMPNQDQSQNNLKILNEGNEKLQNLNLETISLNPKQEIQTRILCVILFYLFRYCNISIANIEIIKNLENSEEINFNQFIDDFKNQKSVENCQKLESSIAIHYERKEKSNLSIDIGDSFYESNGQRQITMNKFNFSLTIDLVALFDLISQSKAIFLVKSILTTFQIELHDSIVEIKPGSIDADFYPGVSNISHTSIQFTLPCQFPSILISLQNVDATAQIPFNHYNRFLHQKGQVDDTQITQFELNIDDFNVKIVSEHFLNLKSINLIIKDIAKLDFYITVSSFSFHYSTLDGLQIFPLYKQLRDPIYTPSRIRFAFPENGHMSIKTFSAKLYLTDNARVKATSTNVIYSNKALQFPLVQLKINKHQMAKVKQFSLSSPDETFLTFSADYVVAHDHKQVPIGFFIMNIIYAWRIIKPWASRNEYDSETLPFPIHIDVKKVCAKFHDNPVNIKLTTLAGNVIQPFLQEKYVMQLMFDDKIQNLSFSSQQLSNAQQKLAELCFNTYKELYNKQKFHKYLLKITLTDLDVYLDSRNLAPGMEKLLHKFDPVTAELYPDVKWETLEGIKIDLKLGSYTADMMTLQKHYMQGSKAQLKGTVIFAEVSDERFIDVTTYVKNQSFNAPGTATDVKLYSDLNLDVDYFEWYFSGPEFKTIDDFADCFIGCIPESKLDPSPGLRWWDTLRNIFRGRYMVNVNKCISNLVGGTQFDDLDNIMMVELTNSKVQITEGNMILNSDLLEFLRAKDGPTICHLPNFSIDWNLVWMTKGGNQRKHLIIPNVDRFGEEGYDTYEDFRATEYTFSFVLNFTNDKISPFVTIDIAHLFWNVEPLYSLFCGPFLNECYERKYGFDQSVKDNMPEYYFFSSLPCTIDLKINTTQTFSIRIFDHFPIFDENNQSTSKKPNNEQKNSKLIDQENDDTFSNSTKRSINGTSIDASLQNFNVNVNMNLTVAGDPKINCRVYSDSLIFNATDLCIYSKFSKELSTSFMVFTGVVFKYIDSNMSIGVSNIRIIANQFNTKYLKEYFEAFFHFLPDASLILSDNDNDTNNESNNQNKTMKKLVKQSHTRSSDNDLLKHLLRRRSSQKMITAEMGRENRKIHQSNKSVIDEFSRSFIKLEVPKVEILLESLQYDARLYCTLEKVTMLINKNDSLDLTCIQFMIDSLAIRQNETFSTQVPINHFDLISTSNYNFNQEPSSFAFDDDPDIRSFLSLPLETTCPTKGLPRNQRSKTIRVTKGDKNGKDLILIKNVTFRYYQTVIALLKEIHYEASIKSIELNACSNDIALIKQFAQEIMPNDKNENKEPEDKDNEKDTTTPDLTNTKFPSYMDFSIVQFDAVIYDSNIIPIGKLFASDLSFRLDTKTNSIAESSLLIQNLDINDIRPDAIKTVVLKRWDSMSQTKIKNPIIRFQCKLPPPVGGVTVVNHLEINIDPTIVNYEATFFDVLIQFVLTKHVKCQPFFQVSYEFPKTNINLPTVLLPEHVFPVQAETCKYMEQNKSPELKLMTEKGEDHFLLRYFKITSVKLNVSYHNPESKVPDINEFTGVFPEINYQDFNCTMETLIEKLIFDISSAMIPQFFKHVIGLNKLEEEKENNITQIDDKEKPSKQKTMLFGKKKPK